MRGRVAGSAIVRADDRAGGLAVSLVLVLGAEKLTVEMRRLLGSRGVQVLSLEKSSGCVDLDAAYRSGVRALQTRAYFYGEPALPKELAELPGRIVAREGALHPQNFTVSWDDLEIYRVGEGESGGTLTFDKMLKGAARRARGPIIRPPDRPTSGRVTNAIDASRPDGTTIHPSSAQCRAGLGAGQRRRSSGRRRPG